MFHKRAFVLSASAGSSTGGAIKGVTKSCSSGGFEDFHLWRTRDGDELGIGQTGCEAEGQA